MEFIIKRSIRDSVNYLMQFGRLSCTREVFSLKWYFLPIPVNASGDLCMAVREYGIIERIVVEDWMEGRSIAELTDFLGAVKYLVSFYCDPK